jgi:phenylpropionate dioxygenase-like ring-hydroxylating dioxygenase large terminal subunit
MKGRVLSDLIKQHKPGHALETAFYTDAEIYEREIERIFTRVWLYAGHQSEIPGRGDYFLFNAFSESVIVIRGEEGEISALLNVCRHRGSRITADSRGCSRRLTCPYHGWTYGPDGSLIAAAHMRGDFDKSGHGLQKVHHHVYQGMIFINFSARPTPFRPIERDLTPYLAPFRLDQARVAHRESYKIRSNWKFAVENYKECYHCGPAHPEYSRAHSLALPADKYREEMQALLQRMPACGLSSDIMDKSYLSGEEWGLDRAWEHYPLLRGHVTGSQDGKPVAPLMGDIKDYDSGAHDFKVGPFLYALAYADHVVLYRFTPLSIHACDCDISWLVNGAAAEGKDYDLARLIWLWDVTTQADKKIIQDNHDGVMSRYFEPGPFSTFERATERWVNWYLESMR